METILLRDIAPEIDRVALRARLHIRDGTEHSVELERLVGEAQAIGRPKALYGAAYVESRGEDHVVVDGTKLSSRVLTVNLSDVHRVFPYTVTCGTELHEWGDTIDDILHRFWATAIQEMALRHAIQTLNHEVVERYRLGRTSTMSPGRLEDWPMDEQRSLFTILGDTERLIGVRLTDSMLMVPTKSVSGLRFPTEYDFESCQLCPREQCSGRKAPYEPDLYDRKYRAPALQTMEVDSS